MIEDSPRNAQQKRAAKEDLPEQRPAKKAKLLQDDEQTESTFFGSLFSTASETTGISTTTLPMQTTKSLTPLN